MNIPNPKITTGESARRRVKFMSRGRDAYQDIRVPMREISVHPTAGEPPLPVYDSSGPYTDPAAQIDIRKGLPQLRRAWVGSRHAVMSRNMTGARSNQTADNGFVEGDRLTPEFPVKPRPLRGKDGKAVTQLGLCPRRDHHA